ncbi:MULTISPECIES: hypothetical protein [unclassified Bradyrhizobium]
MNDVLAVLARRAPLEPHCLPADDAGNQCEQRVAIVIHRSRPTQNSPKLTYVAVAAAEMGHVITIRCSYYRWPPGAELMERKRSPLERQAADALRRARRLPVGADRNDLRQLAVGLLLLHRRGMDALLEGRLHGFSRLNRPLSETIVD